VPPPHPASLPTHRSRATPPRTYTRTRDRSHHLQVMLDAGLLERERRASWAYHRLRPGVLATLAGILSR